MKYDRKKWMEIYSNSGPEGLYETCRTAFTSGFWIGAVLGVALTLSIVWIVT